MNRENTRYQIGLRRDDTKHVETYEIDAPDRNAAIEAAKARARGVKPADVLHLVDVTVVGWARA